MVQEVFTSVLHNIETFQGTNEQAFCGYLAMVVKNRLIDAVRFHQADRRDGRRTHGNEDGDRSPGRDQSPSSSLSALEEREVFREALRSFDEREQLLILGRVEQDVPFHELAEQLGYSSRSAAQRAFYAAQAKLVLRLKRSSNPGAEAPPE